MTENNDKLNQLLQKLELLSRKHDEFTKEINNLKFEINWLKKEESKFPEAEKVVPVPAPVAMQSQKEPERVQAFAKPPEKPEIREEKYRAPEVFLPQKKSDLEKFIGENLINKIGIAITVIGVAIGAQYSIEHDLISPLTRIILGYLMGIGLLGFAIKLKKNYENFSAVLVSGAMAILYFITYAAHAIYALIPQVASFALMLVFTVFTVIAAVKYNRQVIAHIGLVGAYAVPFLLSDGSGKVVVLFSYMAIINMGILVLSFWKYWKPLYYSSFGLTWIIFFAWYISDYDRSKHFTIGLIFLTVFFAIFYTAFMAYKVIRREKFETADIILLLSNSSIYYAIGYMMLDGDDAGKQFLGLFTLCNALIHFAISVFIYRQKLGDKSLFYLVSGLVLVFITIAAPVQLNGNWVTLLWIGQAALLFWIGRSKSVFLYEKLSYVLLGLAFVSLLEDWMDKCSAYVSAMPETRVTPLLNINFLTSVLFIAALIFMYIFHRKNPLAMSLQNNLTRLMNNMIPALLIFVIYYSFRMEIANYWDQLTIDSRLDIMQNGQKVSCWNSDIGSFKTIWIIIYSLLFAALLSIVNVRKLRDIRLGLILLGLSVLTIAVFLTQGLLELSDLQDSYISQEMSKYYQIGTINIGIRYIAFTFVGLLLFVCDRQIRAFFGKDFRVYFDLLLHVTIVWILSSELIAWMEMAASTETYKFGLSILWGTYALLLIAFGIWKNRKHLRIGAIALFGVTLLKLFFYDIAHLNTIAKTIAFVSLGVLLLIISFLYNKYKHLITDEIKP